MPERIVIHVDMDAFYASVEQRENPDYQGRPVVVGADPKGGKGRGVVAGCSYEARKFGIRSAMPISRAFKLHPDAIFVRPRFSLYSKVSDDVMSLIAKFSNRFEQVGIDEAFLDISSMAKDYAEAENAGRQIKQTIRERERLSCSIGIAPNKAVAKIASDYQKPDGLTIVPPVRVREFLAPLQVRKLIGVGPKSEDALKKIGINTIGQLAAQPRSVMAEMFGKYGLRLWEVANGMDESEVRPWEGMKSVSSETTFEEDTRDYEKIEASLDMLIDDVHERMQSSHYEFRTAGIKIRFEGFDTYTRAKSHHDYTSDKAVMREYARELLQEFKFDRRKVRLIGFRVSNLRRLDTSQIRLAAWSE